jgi:C-terminal processing protease CtpA/Prc
MGATTSCHECKCNDQCSEIKDASSGHARSGAQDEEICEPGEKCKSWGPDKKISFVEHVSALESSSIIPVGSGNETTKEQQLHFKFGANDQLGLQFAETSSVPGHTVATLLVVSKIDATSAFAQTSEGHLGVCSGDIIVAVNGQSGTAVAIQKMLEQAIAPGREITLLVQPRPPSFYAELTQAGSTLQKLGVSAVIDKSNQGCILVQAVRKEGLVPEWNSRNGLLHICSGDLIVEVNGIAQDATAMCKQLQAPGEGTTLRLRMMTTRSPVTRTMSRQATRPRHKASSLLQPIKELPATPQSSNASKMRNDLPGTETLSESGSENRIGSSQMSDTSTGLPSSQSNNTTFSADRGNGSQATCA